MSTILILHLLVKHLLVKVSETQMGIKVTALNVGG